MHRYLAPLSSGYQPKDSLNPKNPPGGRAAMLEVRIKALETRMTYLEVDVPADIKGRLELLDSLRKKIDHLMVETDLQNRRFDKLEKEIDDLRSQLSREISRGHHRQDQIDEAFKRLSNFASDVTKLLDPIEKKLDAYRVALHNVEAKVADFSLVIYGWGKGVLSRLNTIEWALFKKREEKPWTK